MATGIHAGGYHQDRQRQQRRLFKNLAQIAQDKSQSSLKKAKARLQAIDRYVQSKKESLTKLY